MLQNGKITPAPETERRPRSDLLHSFEALRIRRISSLEQYVDPRHGQVLGPLGLPLNATASGFVPPPRKWRVGGASNDNITSVPASGKHHGATGQPQQTITITEPSNNPSYATAEPRAAGQVSAGQVSTARPATAVQHAAPTQKASNRNMRRASDTGTSGILSAHPPNAAVVATGQFTKRNQASSITGHVPAPGRNTSAAPCLDPTALRAGASAGRHGRGETGTANRTLSNVAHGGPNGRAVRAVDATSQHRSGNSSHFQIQQHHQHQQSHQQVQQRIPSQEQIGQKEQNLRQRQRWQLPRRQMSKARPNAGQQQSAVAVTAAGSDAGVTPYAYQRTTVATADRARPHGKSSPPVRNQQQQQQPALLLSQKQGRTLPHNGGPQPAQPHAQGDQQGLSRRAATSTAYASVAGVNPGSVTAAADMSDAASLRRQKLDALKARRVRPSLRAESEPQPDSSIASDLVTMVGYAEHVAEGNSVWLRSASPSPTKSPYYGPTGLAARSPPPYSSPTRAGGGGGGGGGATTTSASAAAATAAGHRTRSPAKSTQTDPLELGMLPEYQKYQQAPVGAGGLRGGKSTGASVASAPASQVDDTGDSIDQGRPPDLGEPATRQHAAAATIATGKAHADKNPDPSSGLECQGQREQNPLGGADDDQQRQCDGEGSTQRIRMAEMIRRFRQEPVVVAIGEEEEEDDDDDDGAADPAGGKGSVAGRSPDEVHEDGEEHPVDYLAAAVLQRSRAMLRERDAIQQRIEAALSKFGVGVGVGANLHQAQRSPPVVPPTTAPVPWQDSPGALRPDLIPNEGAPARLVREWGTDGGIDRKLLGLKRRGSMDRPEGRDDEASGSGSVGVATQLGSRRGSGGGHGGSLSLAHGLSEGDRSGSDTGGLDVACAATSMPRRQQLPGAGDDAGGSIKSSSSGSTAVAAATSERDAARGGGSTAAAASTAAFGGGRANHGAGQKGSIGAASNEKQAPWRERLRALLAQAGVDAGPAASPGNPATVGSIAGSGSSAKVPSPPATGSAGHSGSLLKRNSEISSDPLQAWRQLRLQQQQRQLSPGTVPPNYAAAAPTSTLDTWATTSVWAPPATGLGSDGSEGQELVRRFDSTLGSHLPGGFSAARAALADWIDQVSDAAMGRGRGIDDDVDDLLVAARLRVATGTTAAAASEAGTTFGCTNASNAAASPPGLAAIPVVPSVDELLTRLAQRFGLAPGTVAALQPPSPQVLPEDGFGAGAPAASKASMSAAAAHSSPVLSVPAPHPAGDTAAVTAVMDFAHSSMQPAPAGDTVLPTMAVSGQSAGTNRSAARADPNSATAAAAAISLEGEDQKNDGAWGPGRRLVGAFEEAANGPNPGVGGPAATLEGPAPIAMEAVQYTQRPSQEMHQHHHQTHDAMQPTSSLEAGKGAGREAIISHPRAVTGATAVTAAAAATTSVVPLQIKAASRATMAAAAEAVGRAATLKYDAEDLATQVARGTVAAAEEEVAELQTAEDFEHSTSLLSDDSDARRALGPGTGAWPSWLAALGIPRPVNPNLLPQDFREEEDDNDGGGGGGGGHDEGQNGDGDCGETCAEVTRASRISVQCERNLHQLWGQFPSAAGAEAEANVDGIRREKEGQYGIQAVEEAEEEAASGVAIDSNSGGLPKEIPRPSANTLSTPITGMAPRRGGGTNGRLDDRSKHEAGGSNSAVAAPHTPTGRRLLAAGVEDADPSAAGGSAAHGPVPAQGSFTPVLGSLLDQAVGGSLFADTPPSSAGKTPVQLQPQRPLRPFAIVELLEPQDQAGGAASLQENDDDGETHSRMRYSEDTGCGDDEGGGGDVDADEDGTQSFWPIASAEPVAQLSPSRRRLGRGGRRRGNGDGDGAEGGVMGPGGLTLQIPGDLSSSTPFSSLASSGGTRIAAILQHTVTAALFGDSPAASVDASRSFGGAASRFSSVGGAVGMDGGGAAGVRFSAAAAGPEESGRNPASNLFRASPLGRSAVSRTAISPADCDVAGPVPYVQAAGDDCGHSGIPGGDVRGSGSSNSSSREQGLMGQSSAKTVASEVYEEDFAEPSPQSSASAISLGGIAAASATAAAAAAASLLTAATCTANAEVAAAPTTATIPGRSAPSDGKPLVPVQWRWDWQHSNSEVATAAAAPASSRTIGPHAAIHGDSAGEMRIGEGSPGVLGPSGGWYITSKNVAAAAAAGYATLDLSGEVLLGVSGLTADADGGSSSGSDKEPDGSSSAASVLSADASSAILDTSIRGSAANPGGRISGRAHPGGPVAASGAPAVQDAGVGGSTAIQHGSFAAAAGLGLQSATIVAAAPTTEAGDSLDGRTTEPSSRGLEADISNSTTSAESVFTSCAPVDHMWYSLDVEELMILGASHSAAVSGGESVRSSAAAAAAAALAAAAAAAGMSIPEAAAAAVATGSFDIEIDPMTGESGVIFVVEDPQEVLLRRSGGGMGGVSGGSSMPIGRRVPQVVITEIGSSDEDASAASAAVTVAEGIPTISASVAEAAAGEAPSLNTEIIDANESLVRAAAPVASIRADAEGLNQRGRSAAEPWLATNSFTTTASEQKTGQRHMEEGSHAGGQAQHEARRCDGGNATTAPGEVPPITYSTDADAVAFVAGDPLIHLKATGMDDGARNVGSSGSSSNSGRFAASGSEASTGRALEPLTEAFVSLPGPHISALGDGPSPRGSSRLLPPIGSSGRRRAAEGPAPIGGSPNRQDIPDSQSPQLLPRTHQLDPSQSPLHSHSPLQSRSPAHTPSLGGEMRSGDQKSPTLQQQGQQQPTGGKAPTRRHLFANAVGDVGRETDVRDLQQGGGHSRVAEREKEGHISSTDTQVTVPQGGAGPQTIAAAVTVVAAPNMMGWEAPGNGNSKAAGGALGRQSGLLPDQEGAEVLGLAAGLVSGLQLGPSKLDGSIAIPTAAGLQHRAPQLSQAQPPSPLPFGGVGTCGSIDHLLRPASLSASASVLVSASASESQQAAVGVAMQQQQQQQHWEQQQQPLRPAETAAAAATASFSPPRAVSQPSSSTWALHGAAQPTLTRPTTHYPQQQQQHGVQGVGDDRGAMAAATTFRPGLGWGPPGYTAPLAPVPAPEPPPPPISYPPSSSWASATAAKAATTASHGSLLGSSPNLMYPYASPFLVAENQQSTYSYGYSKGSQQVPSQAWGPSTTQETELATSWPLSGAEEAEDVIVTMLKRKMDACMDKLRSLELNLRSPPPATQR
ncbi:hypothetical protein Vretimale_10419 [Volvox reticuliferus]|uniref:Uncharacterized protein n=1 Tax=Volvox reticuliferus TaxID=1737510 RepID=A0A8J4GEG0_9CHLO|nr:hypothetical protein Vretimale_10419 [Volvox reticuliferus]